MNTRTYLRLFYDIEHLSHSLYHTELYVYSQFWNEILVLAVSSLDRTLNNNHLTRQNNPTTQSECVSFAFLYTL